MTGKKSARSEHGRIGLRRPLEGNLGNSVLHDDGERSHGVELPRERLFVLAYRYEHLTSSRFQPDCKTAAAHRANIESAC